MEFQEFPKMARLSREMIVTEKIDGTNAQVYIVGNPDGFYTAKHPDASVIAEGSCGGEPAVIFAGSRSRYTILTGKQAIHESSGKTFDEMNAAKP